MKLAVIDLDGTLFDERHRNHLAKEGNWDAYHAKHVADTCWPLVEEFVRDLSKDHKIIYLTGRTEKFRRSTVMQLLGRNMPFSTSVSQNSEDIGKNILFMRADDDLRPSALYKSEVLEKFLCHNMPIDSVAIIDDCEKNLTAMGEVCSLHEITWSAYLTKDGARKFFFGAVASEKSARLSTAEILRLMADTFEERNKVYGSNYERVAPIMKILFPDGLTPEILHSDQWHLFELIVVKLTRFAISGLQHKDSIHDTGVYAAMIESILEKQNG